MRFEKLGFLAQPWLVNGKLYSQICKLLARHSTTRSMAYRMPALPRLWAPSPIHTCGHRHGTLREHTDLSLHYLLDPRLSCIICNGQGDPLSGIDESVKLLEQRCDALASKIRGRRVGRIHLYARGMLQKLRQAEYALGQLVQLVSSLSNRTDSTDATPTVLNERQQIGYHNDSFWTFLFSAYEILAQIINQTQSYGIREKDVAFNRVTEAVKRRAPNSRLQRKLDKIKKSHHYGYVSKYRHCSNHRRPICVGVDLREFRVNEAYEDVSGSKDTVVLICDDPYHMTPKFKKMRELHKYCADELNNATTMIATVIDELLK